MIIIENLNFSYTEEALLKDLSFTLEEGEMALIRGGNGSGKTTLVKIILGQIKDYQGSARLQGIEARNVSDYSDIGYVPQIRLIEQMSFPVTCKEFVSANLYKNFGFVKKPNKKDLDRTEELLVNMGLEEHMNRPVKELSGGLQQRTMISRALINSPQIIILDEPTAGVDQESKDQLAKLILNLREERGISLLLITHEMDFMEDQLDKFSIYDLKEGSLEDVRV